MVQKTRKKVLRVMKWSEWAMRTLGYVPCRDFGSQDEIMSKTQFNRSLEGQTLISKFGQ